MDKKSIIAELTKVSTEAELAAWYEKYLGKKWEITVAYKSLWSLSAEEKKEMWQKLGEIKTETSELYESKAAEFQRASINQHLANDIVDISLDVSLPPQGHAHLLHKERRLIEEICQSMGFIIEYGKDVVTKYENFYSVNIPASHPATEMHDTYFLEQTDDNGDNLVLRTQTSAMQNELMKRYGAPLKAVIPGKVYRNENTDASHDTVFWQLEGLVIDKDISIGHFKEMMISLLSAIFGTETKIRMRPAYFPFVEPGFEIDASCPICAQKWCSLCKQTGWIEILGAGMVHPNVLTEGGINPDEYTGFAFGVGINRVVAIKYDIKDIRYFTNGDMRFLQSF